MPTCILCFYNPWAVYTAISHVDRHARRVVHSPDVDLGIEISTLHDTDRGVGHIVKGPGIERESSAEMLDECILLGRFAYTVEGL